jgi:nitrite reductase/ring-hydroxylating ferredoxin subunit
MVCGREIAVYRTARGRAVAVDAACPHLGAHLGHTSRVDGETLRCSFHGFSFDVSGACVATGYGTRPPSCSLRVWPVEEVSGFVFVHFDAAGRPPGWRLPESPPRDGWTRTRMRRVRFPAHVQDLAENSVDVGHLSVVHGYGAVESLTDLVIDGPVLRARYAFRHPRGLFGIGRNARAEIDIRVHGLGYSQVEVVMRELGFASRQFVLATPVDDAQVDLVVGMTMQKRRGLEGRRLLGRLLGRLPDHLFDAWVGRLAFGTYCDDVDADVPIWSTKRYLEHPRLAEGDGPIHRYRHWARQFYPELAAAARGAEAPVPPPA